MPLGPHTTTAHPQRTICGVSVDFYSIMFADLYDPTAIPGAWQKFWAQFPKKDLPMHNTAFGVSTPIAGSNGKLHYLAGVEVSADYVAPEGFEIGVIPEGNYLDAMHIGPISALAQSYGQAYAVVLPESGHEMREAAHLELYDAMLNPMADDFSMGILIPVR